jgi:8-oxo-dGTP pyrophosphatase MutT (NUDIX family)
VACIIRIRPSFADSFAATSVSSPVGHFESADASNILTRPNSCATFLANTSDTDPRTADPLFASRLTAFLSTPSTSRGSPEVLFIKRAPRLGDRFTSHVAFPGGKRDPSDPSDLSTAIRETAEEVGIDLTSPNVIVAGNLPERIVTAEWGRTPLMVLCPFVFVLTKWEEGGPLRLQPTEVGSAHWVPLSGLMRGELNCYEKAEVSDRLAGTRSPLVRGALRGMLGQMLFAATRLVPVESHYSADAIGFMPEVHSKGAMVKALEVADRVLFGAGDHGGSSDRDRPLKLWGLTFGIMNDFLDLLPGHDITKTWVWPTVSQWDMRIMIWLTTWRLRKERVAAARPLTKTPPIIVDEGVGTVNGWTDQGPEEKVAFERELRLQRSSAVGHMLKGYFGLFRRGVIMALILRGMVGATIGIILIKRYMRT